jgi:hypothetical protein
VSEPNPAAALLEAARDAATSAQRGLSREDPGHIQARAHVALALVAVARLAVELSCRMCSGSGLVLMRCPGAKCSHEDLSHRHHKQCRNPVHRSVP